MKRLADLTAEDLQASPVWRYEGGSGAEAVVVPAKRDSLSQMDDEIFLAATEFDLFDTSRHFGFCFPADDSGIDYLQPVILSRSRQVSFWFEGPAAPEVLESQWRALEKEPGEIFPVTFRCLVPVDGRTVSGLIAGIESSEPMESEPRADPIAIEPGRRDTPSADRVLTARPFKARPRDIGMTDARTARRRKAEIPVEFHHGPFHGVGVIGDVSPRGMFVRSTQIPGTGPMLRLTVKLPEGRTLVLTGRVVRSATSMSTSADSPGFGLRLADDWPEYEDLLARLGRDKPK